jgi:hypothetical protein
MADILKLNPDGKNELIRHSSPEISSRELMKLKVKDDVIEMAYSEMYQLPGQEELSLSEVVRVCHHPAHQDLRYALDCFVPHLLLINEIFFLDEMDKSEILSEQSTGVQGFVSDRGKEYLSKHFVSGIVISGDGEHRGVTIIGGKRLKGNKVLNLITPFVKFEDDNYSYGLELGSCLRNLEKEAWLYLNGKSSAGKQLNLFEQAVQNVAKECRDAGLDVTVNVNGDFQFNDLEKIEKKMEAVEKAKKSKKEINDNSGAVI